MTPDQEPLSLLFPYSSIRKPFIYPAGNQDLYSHRHQQIPPPFHSQRKCPDHNLPQFLRDLQFFPSVCQLCKSLSPHRIASIFLKNLSDSPQRFFMLHIFHFSVKKCRKNKQISNQWSIFFRILVFFLYPAFQFTYKFEPVFYSCLLYTSDAADE